MARRIPPGRHEAVAKNAYDDRAATFESEHPEAPRQGRWDDPFTPERYRQSMRDRVARYDDGDQTRMSARTVASIEKAIVVGETGPVRRGRR